jgi:hypothetical protein
MKICSDVKDELLDNYLVLHIFSFTGNTLDPMQKRTVKPSAFTIMPLFPLMFIDTPGALSRPCSWKRPQDA